MRSVEIVGVLAALALVLVPLWIVFEDYRYSRREKK
jgi:hypothetical protein